MATKKKTTTTKSKAATKSRVQKKPREKKHGVMNLPGALVGLFIVVIGIIGTMVVRGFYPQWIAESIAIGIGILGWLIVVISGVKLIPISKKFKTLFVLALVGLLVKSAELALGIYYTFNGFQSMAFVELPVVGLAFVSVIAFLISYSALALGLADFADGEAKGIIGTKWGIKNKFFIILTMATVIVVPLAGVLPVYLEIAILIGMITFFLISFIDINSFIRREYRYILGKQPNFLKGKDFVALEKKVNKAKQKGQATGEVTRKSYYEEKARVQRQAKPKKKTVSLAAKKREKKQIEKNKR